MKIVLLSGSNTGKKTRSAIDIAAEKLQAIVPTADLKVYDLKEIEMIFADGRNYLDYGGEMTELVSAVIQADALVIGTPIFQAGIPAALKNIIDMFPQKALLNTAVSIIATAGSNHHYLVPEYHLKPMLSYLKAHVVPGYVFINERSFRMGEIIDDDVNFRIEDLVIDTLLLVHGLDAMDKKETEFLGF